MRTIGFCGLVIVLCAGNLAAEENAVDIEDISTTEPFLESRAEMLNNKTPIVKEVKPRQVKRQVNVPDREMAKRKETLKEDLNKYISKAALTSSRHQDALDKTNRIIELESGENAVLYLSKGTPNRIRTPFNEPVAVASCVQEGEGRECIVSVSDEGGVVTFQTIKNRPIGMFIVPKNNPETSINLSIRAISSVPPQDVEVKIKGYKEERKSPRLVSEAKRSDGIMQEKYSEWIHALTMDLANGELPRGYNETKIDQHMTCSQKNLDVTPGYILNGDKNRIDVYKVVNNSQAYQKIVEPYCYKKGVRFIFAYPKPQLRQGEEAELFVVRSKHIKKVNQRTRLVSSK